MHWTTFWSEPRPADLEYPFIEEDEVLFSKTGNSELRDYRIPQYQVPDMVNVALSQGAILVRSWPIPWGLSAALSIYESDTAWIVADDFTRGRWASFGVKFIDGLGFAAPVAVYSGDLDQAARFALGHGIRYSLQEFIKETLEFKLEFPFRPKVKKWWKGCPNDIEGTDLETGIRLLQSRKGIDHITTTAATKTVSAAYE